jgi:hypothetical protein
LKLFLFIRSRRVKMASKSNPTVLKEEDLITKQGLKAEEVDRRLLVLSKAQRRVESALCYYLQEVDERELYRGFGHASTVDYARERLGFEDRKTWTLLQLARRLKVLPELKKAFGDGKIPWTKAREATKAATPETDKAWVEKCETLSNRQLEQEVKQTLPPVKKKTLVLVLENEMLDVWEQTREACERLAGKTLSDIEVFDLMCAEVLCTFAATPPFDPEDEEDGGYVRSIAERDGWKCSRPGCRCRTGLQGNHIIPRSQGGSDEDWNKHTVCAACHLAITEGRLTVSGRAPDGLAWEGPFGVIEKPLPLSGPEQGSQDEAAKEAEEDVHWNECGNEYWNERGNNKPTTVPLWAKEAASQYGYESLQSVESSPGRLESDHVITRIGEDAHVGYPTNGGRNRSQDCHYSRGDFARRTQAECENLPQKR